MVEEHEIVTYKVIMSYFKVGRNVALRFATNTRKFYGKKEQEAITLGQVRKANNLEK